MLRALLAAFFLCVGSFPLYADSISVSGDPGTLIVNTAIAGSQPPFVEDATTTYSVVTTPANMKITGNLNLVMPTNTILRITLQAPTGATSLGAVLLTPAAKDLVTGIPALTNQGALSITHRLSAIVLAGVISSSSRTITLTLTEI